MAVLGYVAPISQQSTESFHALRRTTEGLVYYTKVNKDSTDSIVLILMAVILQIKMVIDNCHPKLITQMK